jgi:hypothetical protein
MMTRWSIDLIIGIQCLDKRLERIPFPSLVEFAVENDTTVIVSYCLVLSYAESLPGGARRGTIRRELS